MLPHITRKLLLFRSPHKPSYTYEHYPYKNSTVSLSDPNPIQKARGVEWAFFTLDKDRESNISYLQRHRCIDWWKFRQSKDNLSLSAPSEQEADKMKKDLKSFNVKSLGAFLLLKQLFKTHTTNSKNLEFLEKLLDDPKSCEEALEKALDDLNVLSKLGSTTPSKILSSTSLIGLKALRKATQADAKPSDTIAYEENMFFESLVNLKRETFIINPPPLLAMHLKKTSDDNARMGSFLKKQTKNKKENTSTVDFALDISSQFNGFGFGGFEDFARYVLDDFIVLNVDGKSVSVSKNRMPWSLGYKIHENVLKDDPTRMLYFQKAINANIPCVGLEFSVMGLGVDIPFGKNLRKENSETRGEVKSFKGEQYTTAVNSSYRSDPEGFDMGEFKDSPLFCSPYQEKYEIPSTDSYLHFSTSWIFAAHICNAISLFCNLSPCFYFFDGSNYRAIDKILSLNGRSKVYIDPDANGFRMPTEKEWETLASNHAEEIDWRPNTLLEWCLDAADPKDTYSEFLPIEKTERVVKGGSYLSPKRKTLIIERAYICQDSEKLPYMAFRLVRNTF